jgi:hypothetical protein
MRWRFESSRPATPTNTESEHVMPIEEAQPHARLELNSFTRSLNGSPPVHTVEYTVENELEATFILANGAPIRVTVTDGGDGLIITTPSTLRPTLAVTPISAHRIIVRAENYR